MEDIKTLIILRGLPGSGKTTLANLISDVVCSADDYFMVNGEYKFDINKLHQAHLRCKEKVEISMSLKAKKIVLANTNTKYSEFKDYIELAKKYDYQYHVVTVENYHGNSNVHNVPDETIQKMKNRFTIKLI